MCPLKRREVNKMTVKAKVKAVAISQTRIGLTQGKEYEVLASMPSVDGGDWAEIMSDIGIPVLVRVGGACAFGEWEYVK